MDDVKFKLQTQEPVVKRLVWKCRRNTTVFWGVFLFCFYPGSDQSVVFIFWHILKEK